MPVLDGTFGTPSATQTRFKGTVHLFRLLPACSVWGQSKTPQLLWRYKELAHLPESLLTPSLFRNFCPHNSPVWSCSKRRAAGHQKTTGGAILVRRWLLAPSDQYGPSNDLPPCSPPCFPTVYQHAASILSCGADALLCFSEMDLLTTRGSEARWTAGRRASFRRSSCSSSSVMLTCHLLARPSENKVELGGGGTVILDLSSVRNNGIASFPS